MEEKKSLLSIHILFKSIISVYFDSFFVLYFLGVTNYDVVPIVKYYFTLYLFLFISFLVIRNVMKRNIKVPYLRIGISLQALYIATIMLLKENIVNYVFLVGILRGFANGFYYYPQSLLNSEKITNQERSKFDGLTFVINNIASIVIPIILGVALTYMSYIEIGKIFFLLFILMFILSFKLKDGKYNTKKADIKGFIKLVKESKDVKRALLMPFLGGLTYFSGSFALMITLIKVMNFNTNLALGTIESVCAIISLGVSILYSLKLNRDKKSKLLKVGGILILISLIVYALHPTLITFIILLLINSSFVWLFNLTATTVGIDLSNSKEIKTKYKPEYLLAREFALNSSRCLGFIVVLIVTIKFGSDALKYLLIISGFIILLESFVTSKYLNEK